MRPVFFLAAPLLAFGLAASPAFAKDEKILARVNGDDITADQVEQYIKALPDGFQNMDKKVVRTVVLDQIINGKLVTAEANKMKLGDSQTMQLRMKLASEQVLQEEFLNREIKSRVSDARVRTEYQKYVSAQPNEEIKARHMLVDSEGDAKKLIEKLGKGEDFATLAKENNKGPEKARGGDLGWFTVADVVPEFGQAASKMKAGETSKEPVKSSFGWHVIKVEEKRTRTPPKFEQLKDMLTMQLSEKMAREKIDELRKDAKIEIFTDE